MRRSTRPDRAARSIAALLLAVGLLLASGAAPASADWKDSTTRVVEVGGDAALIRPLMFCRMLVGFVFYIPAYGLASLNGEAAQDEATDIFITEPIDGVFSRPLGDFSSGL